VDNNRHDADAPDAMDGPIPLTEEDKAILDLEGDHIVGHTCMVVILEGATPSVDCLRTQIAARMERAPLLCRRLRQGGYGFEWVETTNIDLAIHVTAAGFASTEDDLERQIAALFARPLDRARPLWQMDVVSFNGEALALVWRIHHALADGVTAMRLGQAVLWDPTISLQDASLKPRSVRPEDDYADHRRRLSHLSAFILREFGESLERSPFDGEVGSRRSIKFATVPLSALHEAAKRLAGATVNEAMLSIVAGAIRTWLICHHGELGSVRLRVPVSLHQLDDDAGNRDSFFTLPVSLADADPVERLRKVHEESARRKLEHDAQDRVSYLDSLGSVSPPLRRFVERLESNPRSFALCVSNVPGPPHPIHVQGAPVRSLYTLAEVGRRHGLRIAVVSHSDKLEFGVCADPGIAADVQELARGIEAEAAILSAS
jgi:diacylglycerol O-acyltransferase